MIGKQLKDRLKNYANEKEVDFNAVLRLYIYERFIERLSKSRYKDNFVIKGGFYLSTLFGLENRTTMDIDTEFKNNDFTEDTIVEMINEIINIDLNDDSKLSFIGIEHIRNEDEYGGFRVDILVEIGNIRERFHVDIATGDPIIPQEIKYTYKSIVGKKDIEVWAYSIETLLSEKIETVLRRGETNGRMRDYYDIYLVYTKDWEFINVNTFKNALKTVFKKRGYNDNPIIVLEMLAKSDELMLRWRAYQRKYQYAQKIELQELIKIISMMLKTTK